MMVGLDFMAPQKIGHMSLSGLRSQVENHDKTQTMTRMHELSIALDLENLVSTSGVPMLLFCRPKNHLLEYLHH
jgi:hypothetical protein